MKPLAGWLKQIFRKSETETASGAGPADVEPQEHRTSDRVGTYKVATMVYPSGYSRKGVVVDRSPTGVRVRSMERTNMPDRLRLSIEGTNGHFEVEVIWQDGVEAGLRFL